MRSPTCSAASSKTSSRRPPDVALACPPAYEARAVARPMPPKGRVWTRFGHWRPVRQSAGNAVEPACSSHPLIVPVPSISVQCDMSRSGFSGVIGVDGELHEADHSRFDFCVCGIALAFAQEPPAKLPVIGWISPSPTESYQQSAPGSPGPRLLRESLARHGWLLPVLALKGPSTYVCQCLLIGHDQTCR
jgi:hypothetical protein